MDDLATRYRQHVTDLTAAYRGVLVAHQLDAVVLASGQAAPRSRFDDQYWPTVVTPAFAQWTPTPTADAFVVVSVDAPPRLIEVIGDDYWESPPRAAWEGFRDHLAVTTVRDVAAAVAALPRGRVAMIGERAPELPGAATTRRRW